MDLQAKIVIARRAVESISRHDDEEAAVRLATLDRVDEIIKAERAAIRERVRARLEQVLGVGSGGDAS